MKVWVVTALEDYDSFWIADIFETKELAEEQVAIWDYNNNHYRSGRKRSAGHRIYITYDITEHELKGVINGSKSIGI